MAKIKKKENGPYHVFVDTNTLWHEDKSLLVSPSFQKFLDEYRSEFNIQLLIPDVVYGELEYQHVTPAISQLKKANEAIERISGITEKSYKHRVTETRVVKEFNARLAAWMKSEEAKIVKAQVDEIDWRSIVDSAVWRKPPFTMEKGKEKGFRDAVILETIITHCKGISGNDQLIFLCNDNMLRETIDDRMKNDPRFSSYERISDFISFLELTREELEEHFVKSIGRRASKKFYTKNDLTSLYHKSSVRDILLEKYDPYFNDPEKSDSEDRKGLSAGVGLGLLGATEKTWQQENRGMFWISPTTFKRLDPPNDYSWEARITFVREYSRNIAPKADIARALHTGDIYRILVLEFVIDWQAKVTTDGRFRDIALLGHSLISNNFKVPTDEEKRYWNLNLEES